MELFCLSSLFSVTKEGGLPGPSLQYFMKSADGVGLLRPVRSYHNVQWNENRKKLVRPNIAICPSRFWGGKFFRQKKVIHSWSLSSAELYFQCRAMVWWVLYKRKFPEAYRSPEYWRVRFYCGRHRLNHVSTPYCLMSVLPHDGHCYMLEMSYLSVSFHFWSIKGEVSLLYLWLRTKI